MAKEELQFILSAKDNASPVFSKVGKNASKSLGDVEKQATTSGTKAATGFSGAFSKGMGSLGSMGLDKFLAIGAVTAGVKFAINAASSLEEATSKSKAVFRENAGEIEKWASTASKSFGQSKASALEAAGTFGNLFQAFGVGLKPATEMSVTLTELASDLASFNNTSVEDAIEALRSGLSGETEPLKRYGVALTDARLKQEALGLGLIKDVKGPLDAATKSQAAYSLIMKDTALAQGDFQRTSDGYANSMRTLKASAEDAAASVGQAIVPALGKLAGAAAQAIGPVADLVGQLHQLDTEGGLFGEVTGIKVDFQAETWSQMISTVHKVKAAFLDLNAVKIEPPVMNFEGLQAGVVHAGGYGRALRDAAVASAQATMSADAYARSMTNEAAAIKSANDALQAHIDKQLAAIDSTFAVTAATNSFLTANQNAATAVDDASTAVNEQQQAIDDATQSAIRSASATLALAQQQAGLEGRTMSAKQSQDVLIGTLSKLASTASGPVASAIGAVITKLQTVGAQKPKPTVAVNDQTGPPLLSISSRLNVLNGRTATVSVFANTSAASANIDSLARRLSSLRASGSVSGSATFQEGGYVDAPKNAPVAATVHGGEYVLSADVVDRIKRGDTSRGAAAALTVPAQGNGGGGTVVNFNGTFLASKAELGRMVDEALAESRRRGNRAA